MRFAPPRCALTERDSQILEVLALRVKVLAVEQIAWHWWPGASAEAAKRRLEQLAQAGWISLRRVAAKGITMLPPEAPLLVIQTGNEEPEWKRVVRVAHIRWNQPMRFVHSVIGTHRLGRYFGTTTGGLRISEGTHDLVVAAVYLAFLRTQPTLAATWRGERNLLLPAGSNGVVPDAMIQSDCATAIEVVGESYGIAKLQRFHDHCMKSRWSYQLW